MADSIHRPEIQDLIIEHMLAHAPHMGWSQACLEQAVVDTGFKSQDAVRAFQGSLDRALAHYFRKMDQEMADKLSLMDLSSLKVRDRIATAVMVRLRLCADHREAEKKIFMYLAVPLRQPLGMQALAQSVDLMWYAAGDTATDFNYYSKRFLLAGVYSSTLWYWLDDNSPQQIKTQAFLNRRLDEVMMIPQVKRYAQEGVKLLLKPFQLFVR
jgi:ubiquinone biosynthesis protein COQ9